MRYLIYYTQQARLGPLVVAVAPADIVAETRNDLPLDLLEAEWIGGAALDVEADARLILLHDESSLDDLNALLASFPDGSQVAVVFHHLTEVQAALRNGEGIVSNGHRLFAPKEGRHGDDGGHDEKPWYYKVMAQYIASRLLNHPASTTWFAEVWEKFNPQ